MKLWKAHGLGNDYLVLESGEPMSSELARRICDRHCGPGSDGILEPTSGGEADYGVKIWNPDGSVAEKSGNGLRIFATWLRVHRGAASSFTISTGACLVGAEFQGKSVAVDMGKAVFVHPDLPPLHEVDPPGVPLALDGLWGTPVSVGNPHCVVLLEGNLDDHPWRRWGAALEVNPDFPNRTNVQFVRVPKEGPAEIRIWERGAGETSASGSSSCAVAATLVRSGLRPPGEQEVLMPGGSLFVAVSADLELRLRGPVEAVGRFELDPTFATS